MTVTKTEMVPSHFPSKQNKFAHSWRDSKHFVKKEIPFKVIATKYKNKLDLDIFFAELVGLVRKDFFD